jgi:polysaccharide biosynthesis/export protein
VSRLHTNQVFVIGEVVAPGSYQISSVGTVLTALYAAGGPNDNGTLRRVQVRRGAELVGAIDFYDYLVRGDASKDVRLQSGDVVFVGIQSGRVSIRGPVVRPAVYEILPGETLTQLVQNAGGFTAEASQQRLQVRRVLPPNEREPGGRDRVVLDVTPTQFAGGTAPPFVLLPGDRVEVFPVSAPERNAIVVTGNVWNAGTQGFAPGMTLSQALRAAGGVRPDVYLGQILISRVESDRTRRSIHSAFRDSLGTVVNDMPLQEDDSIYVYSRTDLTPERYVAIAGAVRKGGQFAYRTGMTLRELLLLAGGPLESADLREAEIARFPANQRRGVLAQTFRVPLDSSYLFDLRPDGGRTGPPGVALPGQRSPEVQLLPYDNVLILRQPEWQLLGRVAVTGEVRYPGTYTLKTTTDRITDILTRAGGLTDKADPEGLVFFRKADSAGRIGVNLPSVLRNSRSRDNFALEAGDSIEVGAHKPYVRVTGAVNSPVAVAYVPGARLDYYLAAAGGPTRTADTNRAFVRQPNGSVESRTPRWLLPDGTVTPRAGATIVVPEKNPSEKSDYASLASALTPLIATALTIIAILVRRGF